MLKAKVTKLQKYIQNNIFSNKRIGVTSELRAREARYINVEKVL